MQSERQNKALDSIPDSKECSRTLKMPQTENQLPTLPQVIKVDRNELNINAIKCEQDGKEEDKLDNMHCLNTTEPLIDLTSNCIQGSFS